jgi:hypothetical protein
MSLLLFYLFNAGSKAGGEIISGTAVPIEEDIPAPPGYHLMTRGEDRQGTINFRSREIVESRKEYRISLQGSIVKHPFHPGRAPQGGARRAFRSFVGKGIALGR